MGSNEHRRTMAEDNTEKEPSTKRKRAKKSNGTAEQARKQAEEVVVGDAELEDNSSQSEGESSNAGLRRTKKRRKSCKKLKDLEDACLNYDSEPAECIVNGTKVGKKDKRRKSKGKSENANNEVGMSNVCVSSGEADAGHSDNEIISLPKKTKKRKQESKSSDSVDESARPKSSKSKSRRSKDGYESYPLTKKNKKKSSNGTESSAGADPSSTIQISIVREKVARAKQMRTKPILNAEESAVWEELMQRRREKVRRLKQDKIDRGQEEKRVYTYDFPEPPEITEAEKLYTSCLDLIQDGSSESHYDPDFSKLGHSFENFRHSMITIKNGGVDMNPRELSMTTIMKKARLDCILPIFQEQLRYISVGGDKISLAELIYETNQQVHRKQYSLPRLLASSEENEADEARILFFAALFEKIHVSRSMKTGEVVLGLN